ncbi:MAG: transposase [Bacteroidaceae bacterium]|nr:transposase [Bacteroidaceae bacterium]
MGRRSKFEASFKGKVVLEAIKEQKTLNELAKEFKVSPSKIAVWKTEFLQKASAAFAKSDTSQEKLVKDLNAEKDRLLKKVGELTIKNDFFARACEDAGLKVR